MGVYPMNDHDAAAIANPLFQLNLVIHMTFPAPSGRQARVVQPLLHEAGYEVWCLPGKIPTPRSALQACAKRLESSPVTTNPILKNSVKPDIVMRSYDRSRILLLELKTAGFSPNSSSNMAQLRTYLCLKGDYVSTFLSEAPNQDNTTLVAYFTFDGRTEMADTMDVAALELLEFDIPHTGNYGCITFARQADGDALVAYRRPNEPVLGTHPEMAEAVQVPIIEGIISDDYCPLYIIPFYPGIFPDTSVASYWRNMISQRVRQSLFSILEIGRAHV